MTESYSPNLFLFQSYIGEVLKEGKKIIKTAPFQSLDPQSLLNNNKNQHIDAFHQYFLAAMGHLKTREMACSNYEKLIRQGLVDKQHIPPSLISSVLAACSGAGAAGGSTSGSSSLGSASLSAAPQGHSLYIGNMIKAMLLGTCQPSSQLVQGLNYLLEGTHKKNAIVYNAMLEQIYNTLLIKCREPQIKKFVQNYLQMLVDEVQTHIEEKGYVFASRKLDPQTGKYQMAVYKQGNGYGKFGRCFNCKKQASHYIKEQWLPICGLACRSSVKSLLFQCQGNQPFCLLNWLLDCLPSGEEAILTFLFRELQYSVNKCNITFQQIQAILKILIHQLAPNQTISRPLLGILSLLITKWKSLLPVEEIYPTRQQILQNYFKTYLLQIASILEEIPLAKENLDSINFLCQIMKQSQFLVDLFLRYDSKFFEPSILARVFNLISQYAKKFQFILQGLYHIIQSLMNRFIVKGIRNDQWDGFSQFLKKKQLREVIVAFNKKPMNGLKMLKKLLGQPIEPKIDLNQPQKQRQMVKVENYIIEKQQTKNQIVQIYQSEEAKQKSENSQQFKQQGMGIADLQKEEQPLDSDLIINKRIDEMADEQQNQNKGEKTIQSEPTTENNASMETQRQRKEQSSLEESQNTAQIQAHIKYIQDKQNESLALKSEAQGNLEKLSSPSRVKYYIGPHEVAIFIRQNLELRSWTQADHKLPIPIPSLNKAKIGEFFGTDSAEVRKISLQFLKLFDLQSIQIDDVMRIAMNCFSLPKQTQQIQRIIGDLSLRLLGKYDLKDDTAVFQYIYLLLMVQTTNHNPQVRQNERLTLQQFISMCKHVNGGVQKQRAEADYKRIISNSINVKMKYPLQSIFYQKYLQSNLVPSDFVQPQKGSLSRSILWYLWQYLVIGLVWPSNELGLFQATVLMGRQGLEQEQKGFFQALKKSLSQQSQKQILKLAIDYGNDLIGKPWDAVVKLLYSLQQTNDCSTILDKLFTSSSKISPVRLRDFLHALLQFSSSQFQKDISYTRELFVLRHINSLIQYNIQRFNNLAHLCWPLLKNYFKDICLHPRKQISMAAIDSLKQLSLKLFKLKIQALPHQALFQAFLYIFERSGLEMKDLIANVMLNLIISDIRSGWDEIYSILDVLDTKDKQLVVKLIGRLINEVGLERLGNLQRLHSICIKELRVCGDSNATDQLLSQLWELSSFIDQSTTWLQTIRSIKDIFKISLNPQIINVLVRLCNKCVAGEGINRSLDKEILAQVIDLLLFLLEIRGGGSKLAALITSLDHISKLNPQFQLKHLIGNCGLLQIFRMFLASEQKIVFSLFLKKTISEIYLPHIKNGQGDLQFQYLSYWCVHQFMNHLPIQLLNLKQNDKDFQQTLTDLIAAPQTVEKQKQHVLIQFPESHKQYYEKSLLQLIFLDIVESLYFVLLEKSIQKMQPLRQKIQVAVTQSFDCAFRVNRLILLRNFLWNNGFLVGRQLPGLLKQQHRTLLFGVKLFPFKKSYGLQKVYIKNYLQSLINMKRLKQISEEDSQHKDLKNQQKANGPKQVQSKGLTVYYHDVTIWVRQSQKGIIQSLKAIRQQLDKQSNQTLKSEDIWELIEFFTSLLQQSNLPEIVCRSCAQTLKILYLLSL